MAAPVEQGSVTVSAGLEAPVALVLDFLEWLDSAPRAYADAMDTWRTSCPRLTVWEDALDGGYAMRRLTAQGHAMVELTPSGQVLLAAAGRRVPPARP